VPDRVISNLHLPSVPCKGGGGGDEAKKCASSLERGGGGEKFAVKKNAAHASKSENQRLGWRMPERTTAINDAHGKAPSGRVSKIQKKNNSTTQRKVRLIAKGKVEFPWSRRKGSPKKLMKKTGH